MSDAIRYIRPLIGRTRPLIRRARPMIRHARPPLWMRLGTVALLSLSFLGCASMRCASDACRADARITAEVRALFDQHPSLETPNQIDVQTVDHVVYLRGIVSTPYEQALAEQVAGQAQGVARVVNLVSLDNSR
jgi:BON domain-containing protein